MLCVCVWALSLLPRTTHFIRFVIVCVFCSFVVVKPHIILRTTIFYRIYCLQHFDVFFSFVCSLFSFRVLFLLTLSHSWLVSLTDFDYYQTIFVTLLSNQPKYINNRPQTQLCVRFLSGKLLNKTKRRRENTMLKEWMLSNLLEIH